MSREPGMTCDNNSEALTKDHTFCGTLMIDHTSECVFCFIQTSISGEQTVKVKHKFERFPKSCNVNIKHYHTDNKIFTSQVFKESCVTNNQIQSFCGVNTYHQNSMAENKTRAVISLARAILFNVMIK